MEIFKTIRAVFQLFFVWVAVIAIVSMKGVNVDGYLYSAAIIVTLAELCVFLIGFRSANNNKVRSVS